jgi:two-component system OmpR family response regulator
MRRAFIFDDAARPRLPEGLRTIRRLEGMRDGAMMSLQEIDDIWADMVSERGGHRQGSARCRILVVDDDPELCELLSSVLVAHGYLAVPAASAQAMRERLAEGDVDLVILDLMLPDADGLVLCRELRARSTMPIVMLTARGADTDRIVGLELGADDYLPKPFNPRELVARIGAVLRRVRNQVPEEGAGAAAAELTFSGFRFNLSKRQLLSPEGALVRLTTAEFDLLQAFARHPQQVLSRDDLSHIVAGRDHSAFDRTIDVQVGRLRRKIERDPREPEIIKTVRNGGYVFTSPVGHA